MKTYKFRSVAGRTAFLMVLAGGILLLLLSGLSPLFYHLVKANLTLYISKGVEDCALRFSYILSEHRSVMQLGANDTFVSLIEQYYNSPDTAEETARQIETYLPVFSEGKLEWDSGTVASTNYSMLITERGDCFCQEQVRDLADSLMASEEFQDIFPQPVIGTYLPVLSLEAEEIKRPFFVFISSFTVADIVCYGINLTEFEDIQCQLDLLSNVNISDYQLICQDRLLFSRLVESDINPDSLRELSNYSEQYAVSCLEQDDGYDFVVLCSFVREGIYLAAHICKEDMMAPYQTFFRLLRISQIFSIIILIVISCVIVKLSLRRLNRLRAEMEKIEADNYDIHLTDDSEDEIGTIIRTTNKMLQQIHTDTEQKLEYEKKQEQMQYTLLVSAIDPHFIYNTLNTVGFLAALGRNKEVIAVNDALIGTLKDRLAVKNYRTYDTLEKERSILEQYMLIQSYLCHNRIDYRFEADKDLLSLSIPKNILQPLVENSIKHGLLPHKDPKTCKLLDGSIRVQAVRSDGNLTITISDNGIGIGEEAARKYFYDPVPEPSSIGGEHIGIFNIRKRLDYLLGNHYRLLAENLPDGGCCITLILPAQLCK